LPEPAGDEVADRPLPRRRSGRSRWRLVNDGSTAGARMRSSKWMSSWGTTARCASTGSMPCTRRSHEETGNRMRIVGTMRALDDTRGAVRVEDVYEADINNVAGVYQHQRGWRAGSSRCPVTCEWVGRSTSSSRAPGPVRRGSRSATAPHHLLGTGRRRRDPDRGLAHCGAIADQVGGGGGRPAGRSALLLRSQLAGPPGRPRTFACQRRLRTCRWLVGIHGRPGLARTLDHTHTGVPEHDGPLTSESITLDGLTQHWRPGRCSARSSPSPGRSPRLDIAASDVGSPTHRSS